MKATLPRLLLNYIATMSLFAIAWAYYAVNPYYLQFFSSTHEFGSLRITDRQILYGLAAIFAVLLLPYYATFQDSVETKSRLAWRAVLHLHRRMPTDQERIALLATAVKFIFLPLMAVWLFGNSAAFYSNAIMFWRAGEFFPNGYWMLFKLILIVDVFFFVLAYSIEHPALDNEIRSVEPTVLGWVVALMCYPPFNEVTNRLLEWYSSDYPELETLWLQYVSGITILLLMLIYVWATIALNIKASNLTHRGIVRSGPYAYVRHPAYIAKNLSWWVGAMPILYSFWHKGLHQFFFGLFSVLTWTYIYYLRAVTEERHLSRDPEYQRYCEQVKYRFFPFQLFSARARRTP
jgi:protein-S-isoprenylcysteine O-methyltransferase Ste14